MSGLTLDTLKRSLGLRWEEPYDVIIPYGDVRHTIFETVWTFDLENDQLLFSKDGNQSGRLPLSVLRQRSFTFEDFVLYDSPKAPTFDLQATSPPPYWTPILHVPQRKVAFAHRVLDDFNFQWRHILRHQYNDLTFRKLAHTALRVATFSFSVKELTEPRQGLGGALIGPLNLPEWKPLDTMIVLFGRVWLVASQYPEDTLSLVREHWTAQQDTSANKYLIMSVRHIILCRHIKGKLELTRPMPFLNGVDPVPERAIELFLAAISNTPYRTSIHRLPAELQAKTLRYVSQGPVEAARIGCILGLGLPFAWKDGKMNVERETAHRNRHFETPVESQIWFGDHFSGVAYKGDVRSITETPKILR